MKKDLDEYLHLRGQIVNGSQYLLRDELIHLLYKLYLKQIRTYISVIITDRNNQIDQKMLSILLDIKKDFSDIDEYIDDIEHIWPILENPPEIEKIQNDARTCKIQSTNFMVKVSQYTFEVLMAITEKNNYRCVENLFFHYSKNQPQQVVVKDREELKYVTKFLIFFSYESK